MGTPALLVEHLDLAYRTEGGPLNALRDVSLEVAPGEIVGIVGESGCGKSSLIQAILRLMPANARIERGRISLAGTDLLKLDPEAMRRLRGDRISVVFQDPMTALNRAHHRAADDGHPIPARRRPGGQARPGRGDAAPGAPARSGAAPESIPA
jgi:ABC-type glutathione transport system ATPase component